MRAVRRDTPWPGFHPTHVRVLPPQSARCPHARPTARPASRSAPALRRLAVPHRLRLRIRIPRPSPRFVRNAESALDQFLFCSGLFGVLLLWKGSILMLALTAVVALAALAYLTFAMIRPEKF